MTDLSLVAVDWGTTSFRLWALTGTGHLLSQRQGGLGMSRLKPADFQAVLAENLAALGVGDRVPVIICGMAGAAQGWHEAPYVDLPVALTALPQHAVRVPGLRRDVRILPGLAQRTMAAPDVMRGEETLLLGALLTDAVDGAVCLPGTHSKWVQVQSGSVTGFSTATTGELFDLLANRSTLSHFIQAAQDGEKQAPAFEAAVRQALAAPERILQTLFSVRALPLLMGADQAGDLSARLSGLLIGLELSALRNAKPERVTLISGGALTQNYRQAFQIAGIACHELDADQMARAGLFHAARAIWSYALKGQKEIT